MGHESIYRTKVTRTMTLLAAGISLLFLLAFASQALAAPPTHLRKAALDIPNLDHACGAAVDNKGDVYASSPGNDEIKVFNSSHTLLTSIANTNEPCGLAVDSHGDLFVSEKATGKVVRYVPDAYPLTATPSYDSPEAIDSSGQAAGIAIDATRLTGNSVGFSTGADDSLFIAKGDHVDAFRNERQGVNVTCTAGTYTLELGGQKTSALPCAASHAEVQSALEALSTIGKGNVAVTTANFSATDHLITFTGNLGLANVGKIAVDISALTGSAAQSETNGGALAPLATDPTANYTGVAAYTYQLSGSNSTPYLYTADPNADQVKIYSGNTLAGLKARRTLAVDLSAAGAQLALDPGNMTVGGANTGKCAPVAEQACTAGHLLVYDAGEEAVEEYDSSGELLDRIESAALEDGEPTALAVDRSGTATDGTIYVGAGPGPGAKLLAFGPLGAPTRAANAALSRALIGAREVAVDDWGNVYVASKGSPLVRVYGPDGKQLTEFEDEQPAYDLAVDSQCNVYVLDGGEGEEALTYYEASACPPVTGTSFERHLPAIVPETTLLGGVAVNPANDHVFALGAGLKSPIVEFGTAQEGSPQKATCGSGLTLTSGPTGIDVYGTNGRVYVARNPGPIMEVDCGANEIVAQTGGSSGGGQGCPNGAFGNTPEIAVDQSNGHPLVFQPGAPAREYDAAFSCVAEYGKFATGSSQPYSIAIDNGPFSPNQGTVYVAFDANDNKVQPFDVSAFGRLEYPEVVEAGEPPVATTAPADGFEAGKATLHGMVNPKASELQACTFQYMIQSDYEEGGESFAGAEEQACAESPAEIGEGTKDVAVHTVLEGLEYNTAYCFRLIATNTGGTSEGEASCFGPPLASAEAALPVGYTEATLRGEVQTGTLDTEYRFQYMTQAAYEGAGETFTGALSTPVGEVAGSKEGMVAVSAPVTGLAEATEYRFRIIATNPAGEASAEGPAFETLERAGAQSCENAEYRTGASSFLPDCRAYELVTPADTHGNVPTATTAPSAGLLFNNWLVDPRGAGAGESVAFFAGTLPGFEGTGEADGYHATRAAGPHPAEGWGTEFYGPSYAQLGGVIGNNQEGVGADQRYWLWKRGGGEEPGSLPVGHYVRVPVGEANPACYSDPEAFQPEFELVGCGSLGVDPDAESRFVSGGGAHIVFFSTAHLEAAAAPTGTTAVYDREAGSTEAEVVSVKPGGEPFGEGEGASYVGVSEDGSTILFRVGGTLYAHRGGQTHAIGAGAGFAGVSEDGSRVFFTDGEVLYACEVGAGPCTGAEPSALTEIAEDSVFVRVSPDGSSVLFTSEDALTGAEENEAGEEAEDSERNLYLWDGTASFVAILDEADFKGFGFEQVPGKGNKTKLDAWVTSVNPGEHVGQADSPTRATPDGEVFVFQSHAKLTAYDNEGEGEIYRLEPGASEGERLLCVSCDPSGAPPGGDAMLQIYAGQAGGRTLETTLITNVTDDGSAVFFNSPDRLLPEDANHTTDVYEWKAQGTSGPGGDTCQRVGGCLALISTGQGEEPSMLYGMSADGHDVFISTPEKLVGQDLVDSESIYDARVGGGIPDPPVKAPCQGDACQGQGTPPPTLPAAGSEAGAQGGDFSGEPSRSRCPKGKRKVRHAGKTRCVAKKHKHHNRKRDHSHNGRAAR